MVGHHPWASLEAANVAELLAHLGTSPLAEGDAGDDVVTWVVTGVDSNDYNGVVWARFTESDPGPRIAALVDRFRARGLPALWHVDDASQPTDLARRLEALGCRRLAAGVCMTADLRHLPAPPPAPPPAAVPGGGPRTRRSARRRLGGARRVDGRLTTLADGNRGPRERLYASLGFGAGQPLQHYLARLDGVPAATAQLFLGREAAGVYGVTTHPNLRRRGAGTAVVLAALHEARRRGATVAVLGPTPESRALYERLGFTLRPSPFVAYTLDADAQA